MYTLQRIIHSEVSGVRVRFCPTIPRGDAHSGPRLHPTCWLPFDSFDSACGESAERERRKPSIHGDHQSELSSVILVHKEKVFHRLLTFLPFLLSSCIKVYHWYQQQWRQTQSIYSFYFDAFKLHLTCLYLSDGSFPLLLSCVFQSLVYSKSVGERGMFAHSLTRRGWQKADNHNEQICSCKVDPTEGNCGLFVGGAVTTWAPAFTTVIFLSRVCTHSGDRCCSPRLYCSFYFWPS